MSELDELWDYLIETAADAADERMYMRTSRDREGYTVTVAYHPAWNWNGYATHKELSVCVERIKRGVMEWIKNGRLLTTRQKKQPEQKPQDLQQPPPVFGSTLEKHGGRKVPKVKAELM